jgi:drug/metabolite transporter (DMT)-like permease
MKLGLANQLTPWHIAAIRILSSGIVLLPSALKARVLIPKDKWIFVFLSGTLGSLVPAFLFCIAEQTVDSALAGILNSLTPIFVIITGILFFKTGASFNKVLGIIIAFTGSVLLLLSKGQMLEIRHIEYTALIIIATIMYGYNVNMVSKNLHEIGSLHIASVALTLNAIPALVILIFSGYFKLPLLSKEILMGTGAAALLGIMGTAVATIIFYMLVKRAGRIFASMVTYGIPFVAIGWGIIFGEAFGWKQVICLIIILAGVYFTSRKQKTKS